MLSSVVPHKDPDERRAQVCRDVKRHRDSKVLAVAAKAKKFKPPPGPATISLRTSADVIAAFEMVASIAYAADETLDLCSRLRLISMAALGASRSQDAAAFEARVLELERQAERAAS